MISPLWIFSCVGKSGKYLVICTYGMVRSACSNICTRLVRRETASSNKRGAALLTATDADGFSVRDLMPSFFWENRPRILPSEPKRTDKNIKPEQNRPGFCCLFPGSELSLDKQVQNSDNASCLPWEDRRFVSPSEAAGEMESQPSVGYRLFWYQNPKQQLTELNVALWVVHHIFQTQIQLSCRFELELFFQKPAQIRTKNFILVWRPRIEVSRKSCC